ATLLNPAASDFDFTAVHQQYGQTVIIPAEGVVVRPGEFYLGWTVELLQLPHRSRIAARVEGKSSLARIGLGVHVTAPTIHAGFGDASPRYKGSPIRLEIWNCGPLDIRLTKGMAICQLIVEEVHGTPLQGYTGQFRIQGPEKPPKPARRRGQ